MSLAQTNCTSCAPARPAHPSLLRLLRTWASLSRQRRSLSHLNDALLRDIGITHVEAKTEADRPLWDVPSNWKR